MKKPALHLVGQQADEPEFTNEGRDSDASLQATRRILLGPIGKALLALLITVALAIVAAAVIAGGAQ